VQGQPDREGAHSEEPGRERRPRFSYADPSAVIAADLALSRNVREKGQWQALRKAAAPDAVLFAPRAVDAATWLKRRPGADAPQRWQPRTVWMSCDGKYAVSRGAWTRGADSGEYISVWERQEKGQWKWLLREEGPAGGEGEVPEMIAGKVAECSGLPRRRRLSDDEPPLIPANATSYDGSLRWSVQVAADCSRSIMVEAWDGKRLVPVIEARRGPPARGCS
jgi:hypothetical protein